MLVLGDIAGVFPQFSHLHELQQLQRRRFAGSHWGKYKYKAPLQKFLRYHRVAPASVHITKNISDTHIFGDLEAGMPDNDMFLYLTGTTF